MDFTYSEYSKLIELLKNNGYLIKKYKKDNDISKHVILRHDIDCHLKKAEEFAKFEKSIDVCSTYFVLLTSNFYNVASSRSRQQIDNIKSWGHDIGLHFDEKAYEKIDKNNINEYVENELFVLEKILGFKINVVSMHRPSSYSLKSNFKFETAINSYSEKYFSEYKYLSDSRMCWKENIEEIIKSNQYRRLHILTHPFWYAQCKETLEYKISSYLENAKKDRYLNFNENFTDLNKILS